MSTNLREGLKGCVDAALGIRDKMGAFLHEVFFVERTWSGEDIGDGTSFDKEEQMLPTPQIVDYGLDLRLKTGSTFRQGDIILRGISLNQYSLADLKTQTEDETKEKFYKINDELYDVIHIKEKFVTWEVHLRKTSET